MQLPPQLSRKNISEISDREEEDEKERCEFDLCSSCADKEELENTCLRGHQLKQFQHRGYTIYGWICDVCGYRCSPEEKLDVVEVWRCRKAVAEYDEDSALALGLRLRPEVVISYCSLTLITFKNIHYSCHPQMKKGQTQCLMRM